MCTQSKYCVLMLNDRRNSFIVNALLHNCLQMAQNPQGVYFNRRAHNAIRQGLQQLQTPGEQARLLRIPTQNFTDQQLFQIQVNFLVLTVLRNVSQRRELIQTRLLYYLVKLFFLVNPFQPLNLLVNLEVTQRVVENCVNKLYRYLNLPMCTLPVFADPKGVIIAGGQLRDQPHTPFYIRRGNVHWDISNPTILPSVQEMSAWPQLTTNATFILYVESRGFFHYTRQQGLFVNNNPGLLITGTGNPDYATRYFVNRLHSTPNDNNQPIHLSFLFDGDLEGVKMYDLFLRGTTIVDRLPNGNVQFTIPNGPHIHHIGVTGDDIVNFNLLAVNMSLPRQNQYHQYADTLPVHPSTIFQRGIINNHLQQQQPRETSVAALTRLNVVNQPNSFLVNTYLPAKAPLFFN